MIKKKYFVLTAVLLVGVVLLSGCMGDSSGSSSDTVENLESEAVIESTFNELEKQNINEAKNYFSDNFELQSYSEEPLGLDEFLSFFEDEVYEEDYMKIEYSISNINIDDLTLINSTSSEKEFKAKITYEITGTYTDLDDNTEEKSTDEYEEEMIIKINSNNKISAIKEIFPEDEIKMLESLIKTIETENKVDFESYFAKNNSILDYSDYETEEPKEFNNPAELYDFILDNYQTDNIDFYYYYFETIDSNNVLINFEIDLYDNDNHLNTIDIDATIENDNDQLKITSLEIIDIW